MPVKPVSPARRVQAPIRPQAPVRPPVAAPVRPQAPVQAPVAAPVAQPLVPLKRGPGRPSKAELEQRAIDAAREQAAATGATVPVNAGAFRPAGLAGMPRVEAPRAPVDVAPLLTQIATLKEAIQEQNATIAKLNAKPSNVRTVSDIVDGADNGIDADDWRLPYHGVEIKIHQYDAKMAKGDVGRAEITLDKEAPTMRALLALPRMLDPGNNGSRMRALGKIAVYFVPREDGTWEGPPDYLYKEELGTVWAD